MLQEIKNTIAKLQADKLATAKGARERNALAALSNNAPKGQKYPGQVACRSES
jgi:hypothetical protein